MKWQPGTTCACNGSGLLLGGWMGPTRERPYPDRCPACSSDVTDRQHQVNVAEHALSHDWKCLTWDESNRQCVLGFGHEGAHRFVQDLVLSADRMGVMHEWDCDGLGHLFETGDPNCKCCGETAEPITVDIVGVDGSVTKYPVQNP